MQYFSQCFCGNAISSSASQIAESSCGDECYGNTTQTCGGADAISLYNSTLYRPTVLVQTPVNGSHSYNFTGCYIDHSISAGQNALLVGPTNVANLTVEACAGICAAGNYMYMGGEQDLSPTVMAAADYVQS